MAVALASLTTFDSSSEPFGLYCVWGSMNTSLLAKQFSRIGARLKVQERPSRRTRPSRLSSLDVGMDRLGEFFEISLPTKLNCVLETLDLQPIHRHLLLLVRENGEKSKYLCGHDERHWFVAGIPEKAPVGTVRQAMQALQPSVVRQALAMGCIFGKARTQRKNATFVRQGEWFFLPIPDLIFDPKRVLTDEPLRRGNGSKPHWCEFCYRSGGEVVYVTQRHPNGLTEAKYKTILATNSNAKTWSWQVMRRNPAVYVRGRVRHSDHATIMLHGWHQVLMNTESESAAMRNVAFLD